MRIGILKESLCLGGTERSAANTSKILSKEHEVWLALYDAKNIKYSYGGILNDFQEPASNGTIAKIKNNIMRIIKYKSLIRKEKLDVLYEFISINNPISMIKHKSAIRIISSRDYSVMSACTERFSRCLKQADAMICNSQYLKQYFIGKHPEQSCKVFSVYNFIDTDEICKQAKEEIDVQCNEFIKKHSSIVVSVGRFCKEKGFEFLIESVALARKNNDGIGLVLVGDGDYKQKYLAVIEQFGLQEHVYFTGFQKNPYKYMAHCSCFVLSSLSEGFPNVLAEAMALGLPVIATNCYTGPAEILRRDADYNAVSDTYMECDYGFLSPAINGDENQIAISELSRAIIRMLTDEAVFNKYRELSVQRSLDFSEEVTKTKLNEIFNILQARRKRND